MERVFLDNGLQEGFVPVPGGNLFYQKRGRGPAIIWIHGFCLDHRMWEEQVAHFCGSYTCITPDLRGFGRSPAPLPEMPYNFQSDLTSLLDELGIEERVVLVGLSMGARAAMNFALTYPDRTKALVLADAAIDGYVFREFDLAYIYQCGRTEGVDQANRLWLGHTIFDAARKDDRVAGRLAEMVLSYGGWHWTHKNPLRGMETPAISQLDKLEMPVLIITGELDIPDFQELADVLHQGIKGSARMRIEGAGHMSNMERPGVFNRMVEDFLTGG